MKLPRTTASPSLLRVGGHFLLLSPPSLRDLGFLIQVLKDEFAPPNETELTNDDGSSSLGGPDPNLIPDPVPNSQPQSPIKLGDPRSIDYFQTPEGLIPLLWVAVHRDQPNLTIQSIADLIPTLSPADFTTAIIAAFRAVLIRERDEDKMDLSPWLVNSRNRSRSQFLTIEEMNFGKIYERADLKRFSPIEISNWTLDQLENKLIGGDRDPIRDGVPMTAGECLELSNRAADPAGREELLRMRREQEAKGGKGLWDLLSN